MLEVTLLDSGKGFSKKGVKTKQSGVEGLSDVLVEESKEGSGTFHKGRIRNVGLRKDPL